MNALSKIYRNTFIALTLTVFGNIAFALPMAEFKYVETDLGGGSWQYDYTLFNTSDPVADAGFDLYEAFLHFDSSTGSVDVSVPSGWGWITGWDGITGVGFIDAFSQIPGTPPTGTDIAPNSSLGVFRFVFDYRAERLPFEATLVNPNDIENPIIVSGTTAPISAAVPEPSSALLLGLGIAGLWKLRKRWTAR